MSGRSPRVTVRAFGATDVGVVRDGNEDAFVIADLTAGRHGTPAATTEIPVGPNGVLVVVSDGMGGAQAGEVASALVVDSMRDFLDDERAGADIGRAIKLAAEEANRVVWAAASRASRKGMGATLTAVLVHGALAHVAQVGDSRAYIVRKRQIRQVTKDQSYVERLVEAGVMTREEAEKSPYRNVILQAMGTRPKVSVALGRVALRRDDILLLCSDGLSGKLEDAEMLGAVRTTHSFEEACARMIDLAKERGGEDNITVALAQVFGEDLPEPKETVTKTYQSVDPGSVDA